MPGLRVVGGEAKGRRLKMVPGSTTRPIGDRAKKALFDILGADVVGSRFLDLFAGTGSVGIEALSRGAREAVFVDLAPAAIRVVQENLAVTGLSARATVLRADALVFLQRQPDEPFDYVFVAPPQYHGLWLETLRRIEAQESLLAADGWVIVQIDPREKADEQLRRWTRFDERTYGQTALLFYRRES